MTVPSAAEQVLLDTHPQRTQLYLSIFDPAIALSCQVNGSYDATNQTINYDNVTAGSYTNINSYWFLVALIGTSPGDDDIGRTWVRSATSGSLRFVESDHINWQDDLYITVLEYTEIIPVFPRIIQDPGDPEDVIFYKAWDVAYVAQNSNLGSIINMGSHYAGFLDNGQCQIYWSASGTVSLLGETPTYSWTFEGAPSGTSNVNTPGYVTYDTPGHYRTVLTTTGGSSQTDTSIRYVSIYDRPGVGSNVPILNFEFSEFGGSRDSVGYTARVRIREPIPETKVRDNMLVVVFKEDWYGNTKQSINKSDKGREGILFVGYINGGTIQYNSDDGFVEFEMISPTNLMEITECFSVSVESKASPTTWYEMLNMTVKRAIYHYYKWHSTVFFCNDFSNNFTDQNIQYFDADRTSLYDACNTLMDGALRGRIVSDSLGHIWAEQEFSVIDSASSTLPIALDVTKDDWIDAPMIDERQNQEVSFIEMGGIAYDTGTGASSAYLASAPGSAPGYRGKVERKQGLALSTQGQLNTLVGNLYAHYNSRYPNAEIKLRGNFANLDIAPQEQIKWTVEVNDTPRRISFSQKSFALRGISWNFDAANQVLIPSVTVAEITQGYAGATITIPAIPPDAGDDGGSFKQPPVTVPPLPVITPTVSSGGSGTIAIYDNGEFVMNANAINFIGSIVHVIPYTVSGSARADVIFDACGCSGTFPIEAYFGSLDDYYYSDTTHASGTAWNAGQLDITQASSPSIHTGMFSVATGSSKTLQVAYTDTYDVGIDQVGVSFITGQSAPVGGLDFDYSATLHLGDKWSSNVITGNHTQGAGVVTGLSILWNDISIPAMYLQDGEDMLWYVTIQITDNNGNCPNVTPYIGLRLGLTVDGGFVIGNYSATL